MRARRNILRGGQTMNTLYFDYALEIEKTGSITQAAENLFMTQPTLSKSIKDLETVLGFPVFRRTTKGMEPTTKGREFLGHARKIAAQLKNMEQALETIDSSNQLFSLAIPRVSYISKAAAEFISSFDNSREMELDVLETSSLKVIDAVAEGHFVLGLIRCNAADEDYFLQCLNQKGLQYETMWQSRYQVLMQKGHPLAEKHFVTKEELTPYIEIAFGDDYVPYVRVSGSGQHGGTGSNKRILIYDRAMQFDLLRENPLTYMWVSPMPHKLLEDYGLTVSKCRDAGEFKDLLISRAGYSYSALDRRFINVLTLSRNEVAYSGFPDRG